MLLRSQRNIDKIDRSAGENPNYNAISDCVDFFQSTI